MAGPCGPARWQAARYRRSSRLSAPRPCEAPIPGGPHCEASADRPAQRGGSRASSPCDDTAYVAARIACARSTTATSASRPHSYVAFGAAWPLGERRRSGARFCARSLRAERRFGRLTFGRRDLTANAQRPRRDLTDALLWRAPYGPLCRIAGHARRRTPVGALRCGDSERRRGAFLTVLHLRRSSRHHR
jgi:hypothetical protein